LPGGKPLRGTRTAMNLKEWAHISIRAFLA
jgi:hypothetical protein